ncbi:MAG: DUF2627 domain-containing protein [Klebsiella pneumoniae]|nr:DUF2627 domain-containing protein [Klebsiella pneumoniae]
MCGIFSKEVLSKHVVVEYRLGKRQQAKKTV